MKGKEKDQITIVLPWDEVSRFDPPDLFCADFATYIENCLGLNGDQVCCRVLVSPDVQEFRFSSPSACMTRLAEQAAAEFFRILGEVEDLEENLEDSRETALQGVLKTELGRATGRDSRK